MKNVWDVDLKNKRVVAYIPALDMEQLEKINDISQREQPDKFIIFTIQTNDELLEKLGFQLEAKMSGFFKGKTAYIFTKYYDEQRKTSKSFKQNEEVLQIVKNDEKDERNVNIPYEIEKLRDEDLNKLAQLFKIVFPVYPTNIFDVKYLKNAMENEYFFLVAKNENGDIIGSASAMRTPYKSAEITDCAVHPNYRGKGILQRIIIELEKELIKEGIYNSFSITRAKSVGMNMTVKRLGYRYEGTLINNCIISTGFEDMNVWTKKLM